MVTIAIAHNPTDMLTKVVLGKNSSYVLNCFVWVKDEQGDIKAGAYA